MLEKINNFILNIPKFKLPDEDIGVIICAGCRHFLSAVINLKLLQKYEINIEWYYVGDELISWQIEYLKTFKNLKIINCLDILPDWFPEIITEYNLKGFMIKPFALMMSNFKEILLLDADNIPLINPLDLFKCKEYKKYGNVFWKDVIFDNDEVNNGIYKISSNIFNLLNIKTPQENNFDWAESGQILINKQKCWKGLCLSYYLNYHHNIYYKIFFGDKDLYYLAFLLTNTKYNQNKYYPHGLSDDNTVFSNINMLIQRHPDDGSNCFLHRTLSKISINNYTNPKYIYKNLDYPLKSKLINGNIHINNYFDSNICFVTAFFDIGRDNFKYNSRKKKDYLKYFENLTNMNNLDLIVFIEDTDFEVVKNIVDKSKSNIIIKKINRNDIISWKYNNDIKNILKSQKHLDLTKNRDINNIEINNADYISINNCKTDLIKIVIDEKIIIKDYYGWIDFGMIRDIKYLPETLNFNLKNLDNNFIHFLSFDYWDDINNNDINKINLIKTGDIYIMGTIFIGEKNKIKEFNNIYHIILEDYLKEKIIDDDQSNYVDIYKKYNIIKIHKLENLVKKYNLTFFNENNEKKYLASNSFNESEFWFSGLKYFNEDNSSKYLIDENIIKYEKIVKSKWEDIKNIYNININNILSYHKNNIQNLIINDYNNYIVTDLSKLKNELIEINFYVKNNIFHLNCCLIYYYKLGDNDNLFNTLNNIFNLKIQNDETILIIIDIINNNFNNKLFNDIYNILDNKYKLFYLLKLAYNYKIDLFTINNLLSNENDTFLVNINKLFELEDLDLINQHIIKILDSNVYNFNYPFFLSKFYYLSFKNNNNIYLRKNLSLLHRKLYPCINYKRKSKVYKNNKIKIGFISTNFKGHSVSRDRTGIITNLSKDIFDIHIIYFKKYENDIYFQKLWNSDCKNILLNGNFNNYKQTIEELNLNILIYCDLGMQEETYMLAHCRLAPIQITTWGHSETSGINTIDYYISSSLYEIDECYNHYSEKLILHKSLCTFYYSDYYDLIFNLKEKNINFNLTNTKYLLYPQYLHKISEHDFNLFIDIFTKIQNIKIVFINGTNIEKNIKDINNKLIEFKNRYVILPSLKTGNFYQVIKNSFLLLDSYPHGGCNTSLEAFYYNKIILTKPSNFLRGRFTLGFYKKMVISECIMGSNNNFINMINKLLESNIYKESIESKINKNKYLLYNDFESVYEWSNTLEYLFRSN